MQELCNTDRGHHWSALQKRHYGCDDVSNHLPHDCLLNPLFRRRSKKTSKLRVTGLCEGNPPVTGEFPAQRASNAENVSIWWRHHAVHLVHMVPLRWGASDVRRQAYVDRCPGAQQTPSHRQPTYWLHYDSSVVWIISRDTDINKQCPKEFGRSVTHWFLCNCHVNSPPPPQCRIYASVNRVSICSDNGLSPIRRPAITWTNATL